MSNTNLSIQSRIKQGQRQGCTFPTLQQLLQLFIQLLLLLLQNKFLLWLTGIFVHCSQQIIFVWWFLWGNFLVKILFDVQFPELDNLLKLDEN